MKCKLFGMCVVTLIDEVLTKATNHYTYQMSPKFLINVILYAQPPDPWHHFQENNTQTLWLVQDIQMPWYYWGKIHNLMWPSEWCKVHTLMWGSDWCEQHTTLYTNIECFSFSLKKKTQKWKESFQESTVVGKVGKDWLQWRNKLKRLDFLKMLQNFGW